MFVRCRGGIVTAALMYWMKEGVVTGSHYNTRTGCQPYTIRFCDHGNPASTECSGIRPTPICMNECVGSYSTLYDEDKHYGISSICCSTTRYHMNCAIKCPIKLNGLWHSKDQLKKFYLKLLDGTCDLWHQFY